MSFSVNHVHLKTRDPAATVRFYVENFGAVEKAIVPGRGFQVDLHGLQLNITTLIAAQQTGRVALVMEIEPVFCDVIRDRYAAYVGAA